MQCFMEIMQVSYLHGVTLQKRNLIQSTSLFEKLKHLTPGFYPHLWVMIPGSRTHLPRIHNTYTCSGYCNLWYITTSSVICTWWQTCRHQLQNAKHWMQWITLNCGCSELVWGLSKVPTLPLKSCVPRKTNHTRWSTQMIGETFQFIESSNTID
jgi:hypothetical protein